MESIFTELALYGSKNDCARTETVFLPISKVLDRSVSIIKGATNSRISDQIYTNISKIIKIYFTT